MTRKDYVAIAKAINDAMAHERRICPQDALAQSEHICRALAGNIANTVARDNPRFDRERFLKACGI